MSKKNECENVRAIDITYKVETTSGITAPYLRVEYRVEGLPELREIVYGAVGYTALLSTEEGMEKFIEGCLNNIKKRCFCTHCKAKEALEDQLDREMFSGIL